MTWLTTLLWGPEVELVDSLSSFFFFPVLSHWLQPIQTGKSCAPRSDVQEGPFILLSVWTCWAAPLLYMVVIIDDKVLFWEVDSTPPPDAILLHLHVTTTLQQRTTIPYFHYSTPQQHPITTTNIPILHHYIPGLHYYTMAPRLIIYARPVSLYLMQTTQINNHPFFFDRDGNKLVTGSGDSTAKVFNVEVPERW